jgi:hypothetical protein
MKKKLILMSCMLCLTVTAMADGGKIDGSTIKKITFNGDQVTIEYNNGRQTTTADMAEITIDMSSATSMEERVTIMKKAGLNGKAIYDMKGKLVGRDATKLQKGVYIIDSKKVTIK